MKKLILNLFLLGVLLFTSAGCGSKASKKEANAEQQDPRFKKAEELIMQEFNTRFSKTGDDLYTARMEGMEEDNLEKTPFYLQVKNPRIGIVRIKTLDQLDRLEQVTWVAQYYLSFSNFRTSSAKEGRLEWGIWSSVSNDAGAGSPMTFHILEQNGELKIDSIKGLELGSSEYSFKTAKKVDALPDRLIDIQALEERILLGLQSDLQSAPTFVSSQSVAIIYELKAPAATPRENIAEYLFGFMWSDVDEFSKREFANNIDHIIQNQSRVEECLYLLEADGRTLAEYDFNKKAFPITSDSGKIITGFNITCPRWSERPTVYKRLGIKPPSVYLVDFANANDLGWFPVDQAQAKALAQTLQNSRKVKVGYVGTLTDCLEQDIDGKKKKIVTLKVSEMKLTFASGQTISYKVP